MSATAVLSPAVLRAGLLEAVVAFRTPLEAATYFITAKYNALGGPGGILGAAEKIKSVLVRTVAVTFNIFGTTDRSIGPQIQVRASRMGRSAKNGRLWGGNAASLD